LFIGQPREFFDVLGKLAKDADAARRASEDADEARR
jgi:hypothetical protein